jgi:hypothetical protein
MNRAINWFGVAAGVTTLLVVAVSFFVPWWHLTVGEDLVQVNASPVNTNFGLFGTPFTVPLIWALNLISILTLVASGVIMLLYSVVPTKPYAKELLGFSYKKPLYVLVAFLVGLIAITSIAGALGLNFPLMGTANVSLPTNFTLGANISASVLAGFLFPFWLAIVAAALCIGARLYHRHSVAQKTDSAAPLESHQNLAA